LGPKKLANTKVSTQNKRSGKLKIGFPLMTDTEVEEKLEKVIPQSTSDYPEHCHTKILAYRVS